MSETLTLEAQVKLLVQSAARALVEKRKGWKADDKLVLNAAVWDAILAEAKTQSETAWNRMQKAGVYDEPEKTEPVEKMLGVTAHFEVHGKVTAPIKRFNAGELATLLKKSKYKIPEHETAEFVDRAKIGDKGNLYLSIVPKDK